MQVRSNPLPPGRYQVDLWTPTEAAPGVRDGVPIFRKWREANAARVQVLHAETWATDPHQTRVLFELTGRPGAWPFGALGPPELAGEVGGGAASLIQIAEFLFAPMLTLEASAAAAAAKFVAELAAPELREVRDAIIVTRANVAIIRGVLAAIRNGTATDPHEGLAACLQLVRSSRDALLHAASAVALGFPRRIVDKLLADLAALEHAIVSAPSKALHKAVQTVKDLATDVVLPWGEAQLGTFAIVAVAGLALWQGKKVNTNLLLAGAALLALGAVSFDPLHLHHKDDPHG